MSLKNKIIASALCALAAAAGADMAFAAAGTECRTYTQLPCADDVTKICSTLPTPQYLCRCTNGRYSSNCETVQKTTGALSGLFSGRASSTSGSSTMSIAGTQSILSKIMQQITQLMAQIKTHKQTGRNSNATTTKETDKMNCFTINPCATSSMKCVNSKCRIWCDGKDTGKTYYDNGVGTGKSDGAGGRIFCFNSDAAPVVEASTSTQPIFENCGRESFPCGTGGYTCCTGLYCAPPINGFDFAKCKPSI